MPSIIEGYNYDIFISYRQKENKHNRWITDSVDNLQKPDLLTTFSRSDGINNTNLNINDLTPARDGQNIPAKGGQGHRLFHNSFKIEN